MTRVGPQSDQASCDAILALINGTAFPYTKGLRSHPTATDSNSRGIHAACVALERAGRIHRHWEDPTGQSIAWMPGPTPACV